MEELCTDKLFSEALAGVHAWTLEAGLETTCADVQAKNNETDKIVGLM